jgi:hypothetical protein
MNSFSPLRTARIETVGPGKFVLFLCQNSSHFGFTVMSEYKGAPPDLVCLSGHPSLSQVGLLGSSAVQAVFEIADAKIVTAPNLVSVIPSWAKYAPAGALVQQDDSLGIRVFAGAGSDETFDLTTGSKLPGKHQIWFSKWSLVCPNHEGGWQTIYEFKLAD